MASYSLNKLKADFKAQNLSGKMLIRCGSPNIPDRLTGIRQAAGANSVGICFLNAAFDPPMPSELRIPRAALVEYTGDFLVTFYPGVREPNPAEQRVLDEWEKIRTSPEFQQQLETDCLTDGSTCYWREKWFYEQAGYPYLFGMEEQRGCKRITSSKDRGKIQDKNIRGDVEMVYRLYPHVDGKCPEGCDKPVYPDWQTAQYVIRSEIAFETLSFTGVQQAFCLDGSDKCVCIKDQPHYRSGVQYRVIPMDKPGWYTIEL